MKSFLRPTSLAISIALLGLAAAGCKPGDKADAAKTDEAKPAEAGKAGAIAGLATEKEQVSYMIGMDMGKTLEQVKDEIDLDTLNKALKATLAGEKPLLNEEQAKQIRETFATKMQAKQMAEMMTKAKTNAEEGAKFLAENGKKPGVQTTADGLQYQVVTEGKGPKPKASDVVSVHYKGTTLDGKTFDSSYDRGQPAQIPLGQVVPGWREGILLMPVGSKYKLWIPAVLAYGEQGTPGGPIPPNATLAFEIELLDIVKQPAQ